MLIVLYNPQIPQNTGNIVRICKVTNSKLVLIKPLGFEIDDKRCKRAGLDYWKDICLSIEEDFDAFLSRYNPPSLSFFTSKGKCSYTDVEYHENHALVFGSETTGFPQWMHEKYQSDLVTIPMVKGERCLNLANAVSIGIYEAKRQHQFVF